MAWWVARQPPPWPLCQYCPAVAGMPARRRAVQATTARLMVMAMLRWNFAIIAAAACRSKEAELCRVDPACYEFVGELLVSGRTQSKWRQAIGWIAAYA